MRDWIREAVEPLLNDAMTRAEQEALKIVENIKRALAENDYDLNKAAPYPNSRVYSREVYLKKQANRALFVQFTKRDMSVRYTGDYTKPLPVTFNEDAIPKWVKDNRDRAANDYEAFIDKLKTKVGPVTYASLDGNHVWGRSTLNVVTENGVKQSWTTQQIVNVSKNGVLFNQWPTRLTKTQNFTVPEADTPSTPQQNTEPSAMEYRPPVFSDANPGYDLQAKFDEFNVDYFGGKLERVKVKWGPLRGAHGFFTYKTWLREGGKQYSTGSGTITIDDSKKRTTDFLDGILVHEMCHLWVAQIYRDEDGDHGPAFKQKLAECQAKAPFDIPVTEASDEKVTGLADTFPISLIIVNGYEGIRFAVLSNRAADEARDAGQDFVQDRLKAVLEDQRKAVDYLSNKVWDFAGLYQVNDDFWSRFRRNTLSVIREASSIKYRGTTWYTAGEHNYEITQILDGQNRNAATFGRYDYKYVAPNADATPTTTKTTDFPHLVTKPDLAASAYWYLGVDADGLMYSYRTGSYAELKTHGADLVWDLSTVDDGYRGNTLIPFLDTWNKFYNPVLRKLGLRMTADDATSLIFDIANEGGKWWDQARYETLINFLIGLGGPQQYSTKPLLVSLGTIISEFVSAAGKEHGRPILQYVARRFGLDVGPEMSSVDLAMFVRSCGSKQFENDDSQILLAIWLLSKRLPPSWGATLNSAFGYTDTGASSFFYDNQRLAQDFKVSLTTDFVPGDTNDAKGYMPIASERPDDYDKYSVVILDAKAAPLVQLQTKNTNVAAEITKLDPALVIIDRNAPEVLATDADPGLFVHDFNLLCSKYRLKATSTVSMAASFREYMQKKVALKEAHIYNSTKVSKVESWFKDGFGEEFKFDLDQPPSSAIMQLYKALDGLSINDPRFNGYLVKHIGLGKADTSIPNSQLLASLAKHWGSSPDAFGLWLVSWPTGLTDQLVNAGIVSPKAISHVFDTSVSTVRGYYDDEITQAQTPAEPAPEAPSAAEAEREVIREQEESVPAPKVGKAAPTRKNLVLSYDRELKRMTLQPEADDVTEGKNRVGQVNKREAPIIISLVNVLMENELDDIVTSLKSKDYKGAAKSTATLATRLAPYFKRASKERSPFLELEPWIVENFGEGPEGWKKAMRAFKGTVTNAPTKLTAAQRKYLLTNPKTHKQVLTMLGIRPR